jgi:hypothetical protein
MHVHMHIHIRLRHLRRVNRETEGRQEKDHCTDTITVMLTLAVLATGGLPEINLSNVS